VAQLGQTRVWGRRRVTIPLRAFEAAGLHLGDRLRARVDAPGRLVLERIDAPRV
jgi:bifunctional DNA-binding transcriptional regulator/antitoxin component of YhaV-PrlF toxin-antitoxin module